MGDAGETLCYDLVYWGAHGAPFIVRSRELVLQVRARANVCLPSSAGWRAVYHPALREHTALREVGREL